MQEIVDFINRNAALAGGVDLIAMPTKLLLADDSVTIQRVIELTFSGEDIQVRRRRRRRAGHRPHLRRAPDIVLADIGMPKRSGYEVAAFVKDHPELTHIPVLLLAGAFEPVDDAKAERGGLRRRARQAVRAAARHRARARADSRRDRSHAIGGQDIPRPAARLAPPRPVDCRGARMPRVQTTSWTWRS